ncbi:hypothetical protein [Flavobacterium hibernum]|uniref:Outer membrane protein beta-barrel domain-containing protein n=1 Tax=Flavobacterium hibernum TaxID=37752 RepID=A0A0D0EVJ0_9FLAO|nr:hypothetical protein [Flavobacterium hibernum]KIO52918.1 hypothetical protein IW18_10325 [Flavobacterium hibernum]OXA88560.1 hypothetical protein B0A73_07735 [Flavobacterium hibernum]STO15306.1 Uncharacterised protein [Flavobacterium hibernum]
MKAKIVCVLLVCVSLKTIAQEKDTPAKTVVKVITDKFPTTRILDVQYEQLGPSNFDSKLFGDRFEKGRIDSHDRLKVAINVPFFASESKRFVLTSSLRYKYETYEFGDIYKVNTTVPFTREKEEIHFFAAAMSATYVSTLFSKPIVYNATATVDGNQENVQRVKGFVTANVVLKRTENTTITVGALVMLDPSSIIPLTPLFTYNHKFESSKWDVDFILPQRILFRRELLKNGRISLGTELNSESFYLNLNTQNLKGVYELNQLELKSGITYEYRLSSKIIGTFKGGVNNVLSTRITEKGQRTNRYVYDQKEDAQGYFRFGISYNPF